MSHDAPQIDPVEAEGLRFGLVAALFNPDLVDALAGRVVEMLLEAGVTRDDIEIVRVPGSNEVPYAAAMMAKSGEFDCIISLGVVLEGETPHAKVIADSTGPALQRIGLDTEIPVINGIIIVHTLEQAQARIGGEHDRGGEFAQAGLLMASLKRQLVARLDELDAMRAAEEGQAPDGSGLQWKDFPGQPGTDPWKL